MRIGHRHRYPSLLPQLPRETPFLAAPLPTLPPQIEGLTQTGRPMRSLYLLDTADIPKTRRRAKLSLGAQEV